MSVPGLPDEDAPYSAPVERVAVAAGAWVAAAETTLSAAPELLEPSESTDLETPFGKVVLGRVTRREEVGIYGPTTPTAAGRIASRLCDLSAGITLVHGGWDRRGFAAPGRVDGMVLAAGIGFSGDDERSAAAIRAQVRRLTLPPCDAMRRLGWEVARSKDRVVILDGSGRLADTLPPDVEPSGAVLERIVSDPETCLVFPGTAGDAFVRPLVRARECRRLVVRDATCVGLAPVYFEAWWKGGGVIEVVEPVRLLAVATCPVNPRGGDANAVEFRALVEQHVDGIPVHDVVLEGGTGRRTSRWVPWRSS